LIGEKAKKPSFRPPAAAEPNRDGSGTLSKSIRLTAGAAALVGGGIGTSTKSPKSSSVGRAGVPVGGVRAMVVGMGAPSDASLAPPAFELDRVGRVPFAGGVSSFSGDLVGSGTSGQHVPDVPELASSASMMPSAFQRPSQAASELTSRPKPRLTRARRAQSGTGRLAMMSRWRLSGRGPIQAPSRGGGRRTGCRWPEPPPADMEAGASEVARRIDESEPTPPDEDDDVPGLDGWRGAQRSIVKLQGTREVEQSRRAEAEAEGRSEMLVVGGKPEPKREGGKAELVLGPSDVQHSAAPRPHPIRKELAVDQQPARMTSEGGVSNLNEIRDHRHLLASLKNAHTRSLRAGLLSTLARPEPVDRPDDALTTEPTTPKDDPAGMDIDSDDDEDEVPPPMQVLGTRAPSSGPSSVPLPKVHPYSNFTLFPVHISQLPPPPVFSLPDEVLAIANGHLRTLEPPSEVLPPHVGPLVAASLAFLDGALLAVADATSAVGNYSERERARQRAKEREREEGGWVRVVHAMQTLQVPEDVKRRTLERLAGLYGPSPALRCAY
jgi:hypothetical protein